MSLTLVVTVAVTLTSYSAVGHRLGVDAELDVDLGCSCSSRMRGRIGLLERQFLQVDALDLEHGSLVFAVSAMGVLSVE